MAKPDERRAENDRPEDYRTVIIGHLQAAGSGGTPRRTGRMTHRLGLAVGKCAQRYRSIFPYFAESGQSGVERKLNS